MVSSDNVAGPEPVDPVFASLFRDDVPAPTPEPEADPKVAAEVAATAGPDAGLEDSPEPLVAPVDTGRLFRSQGVHGHPAAVLALSTDHGRRLRTLERVDVEPSIPVTGSSVAAPLLQDNGPVEEVDVSPGRDNERRRPRRARGSDQADLPGSGRLKAGAVYLLVIGVTVLVAFANSLLTKGDVGWPTGVALLAVTIYCALTVRRADDVVAIITPPIAFFIAAMTAGQLFLGSAEGSVLNRAVVAFFILADNWYWIIGATLAAVVIVVVRRRRA